MYCLVVTSHCSQSTHGRTWIRWLSSNQCFVCCAFGLAFVPQSALAGQSARLIYSRTAEAAGCSDESGLRQEVAHRLGYDPFVAVSGNTVVAELRGEREGLKARVYVVRDGNMAGGARELAAPNHDCAELMAAVALALSIAIDPDALDRAEPPEARADSASTPAAETPDKPPQPERNDEPEPRDVSRDAVTSRSNTANRVPTPAVASRANALEGTFGIFGIVATGPAPLASLGVGVAAGLVLNRHWVFAIEPEWFAKSSEQLPSQSSLGVRIGGIAGAVHVGYEFANAYAGALLEVQRISSEGYGIANPKTDRSLWAGAGVRLGYGVRVWGPLRVVPALDALVGLKRLQFQVIGQSVHDTPPVLARLGLGLEARF